jgi:SAM-dependent methyltransferase
VPEKGIDAMPEGKFWDHFYEIYDEIPRQGPGDRASTERALRLLPTLTRDHRILDIGCGAGAQTIDLARATEARIVAVDDHEPFMARLVRTVTELGLGGRIETLVGDMNALPFPDASFDVIWCEGAIFIIGFSQGLASWRRLLVPGGYLVVSELCWLRADPAAEVEAFFKEEGADIRDMDARRTAIIENGYRLVADFVLPAVGWWDNYYVPLGAELERFAARRAGDPDALAVAAHIQHEIDVYRRYPDQFGYGFFVLQRGDDAMPISRNGHVTT